MANYHSEVDEIMAKADQRQMLADLEPNRRRAPNADRAAVLELAAKRRAEGARPAAIDAGDGSFAYSALMIPELDYHVLMIKNPDLNSKDAEIQTRAWKKFILSPESLPYRTDASIGRRKETTGIIVK